MIPSAEPLRVPRPCACGVGSSSAQSHRLRRQLAEKGRNVWSSVFVCSRAPVCVCVCTLRSTASRKPQRSRTDHAQITYQVITHRSRTATTGARFVTNYSRERNLIPSLIITKKIARIQRIICVISSQRPKTGNNHTIQLKQCDSRATKAHRPRNGGSCNARTSTTLTHTRASPPKHRHAHTREPDHTSARTHIGTRTRTPPHTDARSRTQTQHTRTHTHTQARSSLVRARARHEPAACAGPSAQPAACRLCGAAAASAGHTWHWVGRTP